MNSKVAIITAGGSGMGAAVLRKLHQDGFHVAVLSSSGKSEALARELGGTGVTGSNQSSDDLNQLVDATMEKWGRIDAPRPRGRAAARHRGLRHSRQRLRARQGGLKLWVGRRAKDKATAPGKLDHLISSPGAIRTASAWPTIW